MSVDESGIGDREGRAAKRFKIHGILRDTLRTPSVGVIERDAEKGLVKYAKPAGVIASIVPMTNPELTPPGTAIYTIKNSRRGDLLSAPAHAANDQRSGPPPARGAGARGRPGGCVPMCRATVDPRFATADGRVRPDAGHRRGGDGRGGVQLGQAGVRRRRRQLDDGRRRDRRHRRGGPQHADVEDVRFRVRMLRRRQPADRDGSLPGDDRPAATRRWLPGLR